MKVVVVWGGLKDRFRHPCTLHKRLGLTDFLSAARGANTDQATPKIHTCDSTFVRIRVFAHVRVTRVATGGSLGGVEQTLNSTQVRRYYCIAIPSDNIDSLLEFAIDDTHLTLFTRQQYTVSIDKALLPYRSVVKITRSFCSSPFFG